MTEPATKAEQISTLLPGVLHWKLYDTRIDSASHAFAVVDGKASVLIDPLPLQPSALDGLGKVAAICLTGSCHQRSAWRYRRRFGVKVHAPAGAVGLEEEPDVSYHAGDELPGGLTAIHAPGPTEVHYAFHLERGNGVLFCADVLMNDAGRVRFIDAGYQDDPLRTRETARKFLEIPFDTLCFAHGDPISKDPHGAIREALKADKGT